MYKQTKMNDEIHFFKIKTKENLKPEIQILLYVSLDKYIKNRFNLIDNSLSK